MYLTQALLNVHGACTAFPVRRNVRCVIGYGKETSKDDANARMQSGEGRPAVWRPISERTLEGHRSIFERWRLAVRWRQ